MNSSDAGPTDIPILEETIGENFERTVAANPNGDALVDMASGRRWTYAELNDEIDVVARGLMALGIERGERVGMWAPNCPEWTIVQYATAKIGAILVNINPAYRTHELAYVLEQSGVRTLVSATAFKTSDYVAMVGEVRPDAPDLQRGGVPRHRRLDAPRRQRAGGPRRRPAGPHGHTRQQRADQHPIHLGHNRFPEGRDAVAPQHPQQRVLHHRADQPRPRATGCASRCRSITASAW